MIFCLKCNYIVSVFHLMFQILKKSVTDVCRERDSVKLDLSNTIREKEEIKKKSEELSYKLMDLERQLDNGSKLHQKNHKIKKH